MGYTMVIVEDEQLIREDLERSIPWEKLGLELVGSAEDGIAGESLIQQTDPDIVLTDIRLPGQDGLTMLSRCPVAHAVILSGHSDFSYMRQAIRLGVYDYLLKPVDDDELAEVLARLVDKLKEEDNEVEVLSSGMQTSGMIGLPRSTGNHLVEAAIRFVECNWRQQTGLQEASAEIRVSESHLSRLFKEVTGINFLQYLNAYRVNQALAMLENPRMNISEISGSCGFPNPGYFSKIFRRFMGKTPSQYRDGVSL